MPSYISFWCASAISHPLPPCMSVFFESPDGVLIEARERRDCLPHGELQSLAMNSIPQSAGRDFDFPDSIIGKLLPDAAPIFAIARASSKISFGSVGAFSYTRGAASTHRLRTLWGPTTTLARVNDIRSPGPGSLCDISRRCRKPHRRTGP